MNSKFEDLDVYRISDFLSDRIWDIVVTWDSFAKETIGKQIVKAADSIASNIAEGSGRCSNTDFNRFLKISRGSLFEAKHWTKKALKRKLFNDKDHTIIMKNIEELIPKLSALINYLKNNSK